MHAARTITSGPVVGLVAALVAALVAGALAACTPAEEPRLAVGLDAEGRPTVHLYLCGDKHAAHDATVYLNPWPPATPSATAPATGAPSNMQSNVSMGDLWSIWNGTGTGNLWIIPIGTTPDGWHDELDPPRPVTFTGTGRYVAGAWTDPPQPISIFFTLADLAGLKDGEVWGRNEGRGDERVITLKAFREQAADSC